MPHDQRRETEAPLGVLNALLDSITAADECTPLTSLIFAWS